MVATGGGYYWDSNFATVDTKTIDISKEIEKDVRKLNGDGDFRSEECIELLKQADIVVTNPPFSLFREYVTLLMDYKKQFIIIGNMNAITYKDIFPLIKGDKMFVGVSIKSGDREFAVSKNYPLLASGFRVDEQGNKFIRVKGVRWFTSFNVHKNDYLELTKEYNENEYSKYDNYDAINVDKTKDIPKDYYDVVGVPITFLDKHNQNQFEIVGFRKGDDGKDLRVGGKDKFSRVLIKRKGVV